MKRKPTAFVATCQCGLVVGAMDAVRTSRADAGKMLGNWLSSGCTVTPHFEGTLSIGVQPCQCERQAAQKGGA